MSTSANMVEESAKMAPPAAVGGMTLFGIPLPEVVLWVTLIYTATNLYVLVRDKLWRDRNGRE